MNLDDKIKLIKEQKENQLDFESFIELLKLIAEVEKEICETNESSNEQVFYTLEGRNEMIQEVISIISKINIK